MPYAQYSGSVNSQSKRCVKFNCQTMTPSCIVSSFCGNNSSSDVSTAPTTTTKYATISDISLYFDYSPYYGYNVSFTNQSSKFFTGYISSTMMCIIDTTGTSYYWYLIINQYYSSSNAIIYNELNVDPTLAYILSNNTLIPVTTNQPQFVTAETYLDVTYYVLNAGTYTFTLYSVNSTTNSLTIDDQLTNAYSASFQSVVTTVTPPTQTIT